jgi:hypothetical protein
MSASSARTLTVPINKPQQLAFAALQRGNTVFIGWGRGVGKSKFIQLAWWKLVAEWDGKLRTEAISPFRGVRITVLMPTLKQFKDVHWAGIVEALVGGDWAWLGGRMDRQSGQIRFPGGSSIRPFPANEYNARTALGLRTDVLVIDECDDVPAHVYDAVAMPWLSEPWSLAMQIIAGTPNKGRHGLWWRTHQQGMLGGKVRRGEPNELDGDPDGQRALATVYAFRATYKDAPENVGAAAVAKARATTLPTTFRREWEADPDAGEGLVYPFEETIHVREPPKGTIFREFIVGMDHGWVDPGVLVRGGIYGHGEDAALWLLDEHYETEVPNHIWNARAQDWSDAQFWPDPSRPDRIRDIRAMGIRVGETDNDILAGIARVANLLFIRQTETGERWSRLYVSPKCKNTIAEFGKYRRKKLPDGSFDEKPEDKWNHAMDSVRYMAVGRFGRMPNVRSSVSGR